MLKLVVGFIAYLSFASGNKISNCRFAKDYKCSDFFDADKVDSYLSNVMKAESRFAQFGVSIDPLTGYTYDGHPLTYADGSLYGTPHLFSAPSKESIHVAVLALAVSGNKHALEFTGGMEGAISMLELKMKGYLAFNSSYPAFGCFTPWVGFNLTRGTFDPIDSWSNPYKVPGLDNGEWFWALYGVAVALQHTGAYPQLTNQYWDFVQCQKDNAKNIFYRGNGEVSAVVYIQNPFDASQLTNTSNYVHADGYLNDPYEGETMTLLLYLYSLSDSSDRQLLWTKKRGLFKSVDYTTGAKQTVTSQVCIYTCVICAIYYLFYLCV